MADILREIDEDLRRDNLVKLWRRYGIWIIMGAALIIAMAAGLIFWREYRSERHAAEAERYAAILNETANIPADMAAALSDFARNAEAYKALARLQQAAALIDAGQEQAALTVYQEIARDTQVDNMFRNAALVLWGQRALANEEPVTIEAMMSPVLKPQAPFHFTGRELLGLAMLKSGNMASAKEIFQALADEPQAPAALRARSAELLLTIPN